MDGSTHDSLSVGDAEYGGAAAGGRIERQLTRLVQAMPRLLARSARVPVRPKAPPPTISEESERVIELSRLLLDYGCREAMLFVEAVRARGLSLETIYLELI